MTCKSKRARANPSLSLLIYGENAEALSIRHLAAEQKCAVADLLQGLTLYNNSNDKDGFAQLKNIFADIPMCHCSLPPTLAL